MEDKTQGGSSEEVEERWESCVPGDLRGRIENRESQRHRPVGCTFGAYGAPDVPYIT